MKSRLLTLIGICLFLNAFSQKDNSAVDQIISREMNERKIPGLQVAIVKAGKLVFKKSYGLANVQDSVKVDDQSIFAINSCTKVFTAVAIMQLVESGKVELSAPISRYLDVLPPQWPQVTINQMLTHTSGFPDLLKVLDPLTGGVGALKSESAVWEKVKSLPMDFSPR
ncbi:serine hydrolase domain-containing protein [Pedobacter aquatilis]|uniref:serine hydrolase domain-containing protein n=1 Tax=Pedobacter aquatilis TaxID=351343 RepID=UPI0025B57749|nr:serine hydrolase domain-containing protein [Pedobacter aquatilis]MDN3588202.1 serine hydrolase domain-containing protein [Pedobacter aquatilis]